MGAEDVGRQALNVYRMQLLGATVVPVESGHPHAQGRDQRGDSRLGHQRSHHALHHRLGGRPRSVSADGARLPGGHRPRGAGADARARSAGCRARWWPASAAARNAMGIFTAFLDDAEVELVGVEAAGEGTRERPPQRHAQRGHAGRAARQPELSAAGRRRPGGAGALGVGRAGLSGRRARAQLAARHRPGPLRLRHRRRGAGRLPGALPAGGDHSRAGDRARHRLGATVARALGRRRSRCWSASAGGATRTWPTWPRLLGSPA